MWELLHDEGGRPPSPSQHALPPKKDNFHSSPSVAKTPWCEGQPRENMRKHPEPAMSLCRQAGLDWTLHSGGNGTLHGRSGQWEKAGLWGCGTNMGQRTELDARIG